MDSELPFDKQMDILQRYIADLEHKIASWGAYNSQSDPGAVMELRSWKKELKKAEATREALCSSNAKPAAAESKTT